MEIRVQEVQFQGLGFYERWQEVAVGSPVSTLSEADVGPVAPILSSSSLCQFGGYTLQTHHSVHPYISLDYLLYT